MKRIRLGVNIDHVATVRNARGEIYPSPLRAALLAEKNGADSVTIHLREDRRHIRDHDLKKIKFQLFCFGNTYLSNVPSCNFKNERVSEEELKTIFNTLKEKYKVKFFLLPDYFLKSLSLSLLLFQVLFCSNLER